ncbi:FGGY-family carbohydrate kinase [Granulicella sp. dw_53]|uniref:rhamnulokinase n=1 Tax=Granulicella sp. dw_53 TaxID=2719792 RepID=UPI00210800CE|nr:FGGY-family carbohydrate kinase [Granulicella sp. dw_53]
MSLVGGHSEHEIGGMTMVPADTRASIAVDLGAESCRVSLLRWVDGKPVISLVERFGNAPREVAAEAGGGLRWDLARIVTGLDEGLKKCAALATEGIRSIAVDGWAVDYVRVDAKGQPLADPFCYRDERTVESEKLLYERIRPDRLRELTGVQLIRINSLYQLYADKLAGIDPGVAWMNLPEYVLSRWGGECVAEHTNATHTQMVELYNKRWCTEIFEATGLDVSKAAKIVPPGTIVGKLKGPLAELPAFRDTVLVAPACHDTASAIAGIPALRDDWAYISSGTWSLVGTLVEQARNGAAEREENFTNLGAVGDRICFHKNVNGMWLIKQCTDAWAAKGRVWDVVELVAAAEKVAKPEGLLDVDDPELMLAGRMLERINTQRLLRGLEALDESPDAAPVFASLIFHSLAARYAEVLDRIALHSGKQLKRLFVVGGASRNEFLNRLTREATGLDVYRGSAESSTVGNFAVQLAALEGSRDIVTGVYAEQVSRWALIFVEAMEAGAQ